jgi:hypothetical protein
MKKNDKQKNSANWRGHKGPIRRGGTTGQSTPRDVAVMRLGGTIPFGFPHQLLTRVRYYDTYAMTVTVGSLGKQVMRWNSTFDPDFTGSGHQPLYRDTYAGIYDHYAVVAAEANIKIVNVFATSPLIVGCVTDDDSSSAGTVSVLCEQNTGEHMMLPPLSGSLSSVTFTPQWNCKRVLGVDPYSSEEYKTAVGSNPTEESYLHIWGTVTDGTSSTSIIVSVELVQTVLWTELTTPSSS